MDRDTYNNEAFRQLGDREVYRETPTDLTHQMAEMVSDRIRKLLGDGYIDDKILVYLLVNSTSRAYGATKELWFAQCNEWNMQRINREGKAGERSLLTIGNNNHMEEKDRWVRT